MTSQISPNIQSNFSRIKRGRLPASLRPAGFAQLIRLIFRQITRTFA
jgi:hypothetical protein